MVPRVAAVVLETNWHSQRLTRCEARLTRALTDAESERMRRYPEFSVSSDLVIYTCRPEESEVTEKRLGLALEEASEGAGQVKPT